VSYDQQLRIWDVASGRVLRSVPHPENIDAVAFSPDGSLILTGDGSGNIKAFDVGSGRPVWSFKGTSSVQIVWSMTFSPDGTKLLAAVGHNGAKFLDAKTGRLIRAFDGHRPDYITSGAEFSADGSHILTSSHDETVKYWDVASGKLLRSFDIGSVGQPTFSSLLKNLEMENFHISAGRFWSGTVELDVISTAQDKRAFLSRTSTPD
jgi:WD40 repeat protein